MIDGIYVSSIFLGLVELLPFQMLAGPLWALGLVELLPFQMLAGPVWALL